MSDRRQADPSPPAPGQGGLTLLAPGLWRWERRHPEWHPGRFGAVVACYLAHVDDTTLLVDPLVDGHDDPVLAELDARVTGKAHILITIPYHTRSAELLQQRYRARGAQVFGHPLVAKRLADATILTPLTGGEILDGLVRAHRIGKPVRAEMPLEIPPLGALVFGDAVVEHAGGLHVWECPLDTENRRRWYDERFLPTLRQLTKLAVDKILVTHGQAVMHDGTRALAEALDRGPWQRPRAADDPTG